MVLAYSFLLSNVLRVLLSGSPPKSVLLILAMAIAYLGHRCTMPSSSVWCSGDWRQPCIRYGLRLYLEHP